MFLSAYVVTGNDQFNSAKVTTTRDNFMKHTFKGVARIHERISVLCLKTLEKLPKSYKPPREEIKRSLFATMNKGFKALIGFLDVVCRLKHSYIVATVGSYGW